MENRILKDTISLAKERNLNILNVIVRQNGEIIDRYNFQEEKPSLLWSVSKSITSLAVGIAIDEGYFNLENKVIDFFKERESNNKYINSLTIHDLLCMGTGHEKCPIVNADWSQGQKWDIEDLFFQEPFVNEPGRKYIYDNSAAYMLSKIIKKATTLDLDDYLFEKLFKPLGIKKPKWDRCPQEVVQGFTGLYLTAEELSKVGQLVLNEGEWNGKQIISRDYIKKATSVQISTGDFTPYYATEDHHQGYGYQFWINSYKGSYRMDGMYGQYVVILPNKHAVVVYVSNEPKNMTGILELTWETLIDKL